MDVRPETTIDDVRSNGLGLFGGILEAVAPEKQDCNACMRAVDSRVHNRYEYEFKKKRNSERCDYGPRKNNYLKWSSESGHSPGST